MTSITSVGSADYLVILERESNGLEDNEYFKRIATIVQRISEIIRFTKEYKKQSA